MTSRVRRLLKQVLELDASERRALQGELERMNESVIDLDSVSAENRPAAVELKRRIDSYLRGEATTVTASEGAKIWREMMHRRRAKQHTHARRTGS